MRKVLLWILSLLFSGCVAHPPREYHVVTRIDVTVSHNAQITEYRFAQPEQLQAVLSYLRRLETYAPADISADTFRSDAFRIVLHRSDGTQTVYHQIADGYLQKNGGSWVKTDPTLASALRRLLESLSVADRDPANAVKETLKQSAGADSRSKRSAAPPQSIDSEFPSVISAAHPSVGGSAGRCGSVLFSGRDYTPGMPGPAAPYRPRPVGSPPPLQGSPGPRPGRS